MISINLVLIVCAVVCWLFAAMGALIGLTVTRVNLTALGLFFFGLSLLVRV